MNHCRIASSRFNYLSEEIQKVFPSEDKSIYFTPFRTEINKKGQKIRNAAGGKLLHHYNYVKGQLLKWKVLIPAANAASSPASNSNNDSETAVSSESEFENLQWLSSGHLEPQLEILERWKGCIKERRSRSLRLNSEYVLTYPCFEIYPEELVRILNFYCF